MQALIEALMIYDSQLLLWIQDNLRNDFLTQILTVVTRLGDSGIFWIALTVILLIPKSTRKAALVSAVALLGSLLVVNILIKPYVIRIRPYEVLQTLELLVPEATDFSFPSGHASASFASSVAILLNTRKWLGIPCVILAAIIAFSRLYVGIHYPTDVLFGIIIGILLALIAHWIFGARLVDKKKAKNNNY